MLKIQAKQKILLLFWHINGSSYNQHILNLILATSLFHQFKVIWIPVEYYFFLILNFSFFASVICTSLILQNQPFRRFSSLSRFKTFTIYQCENQQRSNMQITVDTLHNRRMFTSQIHFSRNKQYLS